MSFRPRSPVLAVCRRCADTTCFDIGSPNAPAKCRNARPCVRLDRVTYAPRSASVHRICVNAMASAYSRPNAGVRNSRSRSSRKRATPEERRLRPPCSSTHGRGGACCCMMRWGDPVTCRARVAARLTFSTLVTAPQSLTRPRYTLYG